MTDLTVIQLISAELHRARSIHHSIRSAHEGYAVILEELDELKEEVWKRARSKKKMRAEAVQVAAMAARFAVDVCGGDDD